MLSIQRLNMDNSWLITWEGVNILLDPWLLGSEVDGFSWFNEQWHATTPFPISELPRLDLVLVSQPYSDHCHADTIQKLQADVPIMAVPSARKRLHKELGSRNIEEIPEASASWFSYKGVEIARLHPGRLIDPIYHALLIRCGDDVIFYAPHGFELKPAQLKILSGLKVRLLITSFAYFRLPFFLGGLINPGFEGAERLMTQLQPAMVVNTHDENKIAKGVVIKLATRLYPNTPELSRRIASFTEMPDYRVVEVPLS